MEMRFQGITCQGKCQFTVLRFTNNLREYYEINFGNEVEKRQSVVAMIGGETGYLYSIFWMFWKSFHRGHLIYYHQYTLIVFL